MSTKVITGKVRLSYVHLFEKFSNIEGQDPKFSCMLLVPKSDKATISALRAAEKEATEQGKSSKWNGKIPAGLSSIIRDGDEYAEEYPERAGCLFMTVSSNNRPGVVDQSVQPILDSTEVYSGCYARASLNAFPYSAAGNKGVSFGLNHVQKVSDGEALGGITRAEDDFSEIEDADLI